MDKFVGIKLIKAHKGQILKFPKLLFKVFSNMFLGRCSGTTVCRLPHVIKVYLNSIVGFLDWHMDMCWCLGDNATTCVTTRKLSAILRFRLQCSSIKKLDEILS